MIGLFSESDVYISSLESSLADGTVSGGEGWDIVNSNFTGLVGIDLFGVEVIVTGRSEPTLISTHRDLWSHQDQIE